MVNLGINSIPQHNTVNFKQKKDVTNPSEKSNNKDLTSNLCLGAFALASVAIAGLAIRKSWKQSTVNENIEKIVKIFKGSEHFNKRHPNFDIKEIKPEITKLKNGKYKVELKYSVGDTKYNDMIIANDNGWAEKLICFETEGKNKSWKVYDNFGGKEEHKPLKSWTNKKPSKPENKTESVIETVTQETPTSASKPSSGAGHKGSSKKSGGRSSSHSSSNNSSGSTNATGSHFAGGSTNANATKPQPKVKPNSNTQKFEEDLLKEETLAINEQKQKLAESNARNQQWLDEQHKIKEQEYSDFWNTELTKQEQIQKGKEAFNNISHNLDGRMSVKIKEGKSRELQELADQFRGQEIQAQRQIQRQAEQGREIYENMQRNLDGRMSVKIKEGKSKELQELADQFRGQEIQAQRQIIRQNEAKNWMSTYLDENIHLRNALQIPKNYKVQWSEELGEPFIKTKRNRYLTFNREQGVWSEWTPSQWNERLSFSEWYIPIPARSSIIAFDKEGIILRRIRSSEMFGDYKYTAFNQNMPETVFFTKDGKITKFNRKTGNAKHNSISQSDIMDLDSLFRGEHTPDNISHTQYKIKRAIQGKINHYVETHPEGAYRRVNKTITLHTLNGQERIKIVYEGKDYDIDSKGRLLLKVKVHDPMVARRNREATSWYTASKKQEQKQVQRQKVLA